MALPNSVALLAGVFRSSPQTYFRICPETEVLQLCRSALISWADMVLAPSVAGLFKWRQFEPEMILLAVGWYFQV
jgi:hypothetical protein